MFRSFEFFTAINFLAVSAHFFALVKLLNFFFLFKHKWNKTNLDDSDRLEDPNEKKFFCSFNHFMFVKSNPHTLDKVPGLYLPLITSLFERIDSLKSLGMRNLVIYIVFCLLYLAQITLHFIVTFVAPERPKFYGQICWVQHLILITFWVILWRSLNRKMNSYSRSIIKALTDFEEKHKCTYRILPKNKIIEFNFDVNSESDEEDEDSDTDESKQLYPSEHNFEDIFGEEAEMGKVKKNQIKPLKMGKSDRKKGRSRSRKKKKSKPKKKKKKNVDRKKDKDKDKEKENGPKSENRRDSKRLNKGGSRHEDDEDLMDQN